MNWTFWKKKIIQLECRGLSCPQPLIKTKNALEQGNRIVEVTVDNEAAKNNISRLAAEQNCTITCTTSDNGSFTLLLRAGRTCLRRKKQNTSNFSCSNQLPANGLVYVISSAAMGRGNDELGWALLQTYI
ncbi:MAG: hypothetical protein D3923_16175, partial [Candidatus Electrothrix sp. AR3]|nr:hypothetical protein [Candidatus Electrothrix sp. AR3]